MDFLRRKSADVVGVQETRVMTQERCVVGMTTVKKAKWKTRLVEADATCKGYASAGVAIACRSHFGAFSMQEQVVEYDAARIAHLHIGAVCRGGMHCFSVYLHTCEGMSARNQTLLLQLARLVKAVTGPWVVMGDWNMELGTLEAAGWAEEVEGKILCPTLPTCKGSVLDCFVIDRRLMHAVLYVRRLDNFGLHPHSPVRLALMAEPRKLLVRTLVAPQRVPATMPLGCLTKEQTEMGAEGRGGNGGVGDWMGGWLARAEGVWAEIWGREGKERERMSGRAEGPKLVWKSALGPPADKVLFATVVSRSWGKIVNWCATIVQAGAHVGARGDRWHPLSRAAMVARRKIRAAAKWEWQPGAQRDVLWDFLRAFEENDAGRGDDDSAMVTMRAWAEREGEKASRDAAAESTRKFQQWIHEGHANGLSRQHAMSKCAGQWVQGKRVKEKANEEGLTSVVGQWGGSYVDCELGKLVATVQARGKDVEVPANIQQEVELEGKRWAKEWAAGEMLEGCQWPEDMGRLAEITAHQIVQAASTFTDSVGLGWDRLHPKALVRLPEAMLSELGKIMAAAEEMGSWGDSVGIVIAALLPKGDGGWRAIGLLPTIVRVWARVRGGMVKDWEEANDREYLYGGKGKGAQIAAWKFAARRRRHDSIRRNSRRCFWTSRKRSTRCHIII